MAKAEGFRFCGVSEKLLEEARRLEYAWRNKRELKWFLGDMVAGVPDFAGECKKGYDQIQAACGLGFTQTKNLNEADLRILTRQIDGAGGTLAEHELPQGNDVPLRGWFDKGDSFTTTIPPGQMVLFGAVFLHETCHGCGLPHTQTKNSLMNPYYNPTIYTLTAWEKGELTTRYGAPIRPVDPTPTPTPPGGGESLRIEVTGVTSKQSYGSLVIPRVQSIT